MSDLQELIIGSTRIVALRDGELSLPKEILLNIDDDTSTRGILAVLIGTRAEFTSSVHFKNYNL